MNWCNFITIRDLVVNQGPGVAPGALIREELWKGGGVGEGGGAETGAK